MGDEVVINKPISESEIHKTSASYEAKGPGELLTWAFRTFGSRMALVTSFQAEGMVILDIASRINP